MKLWPNLLASVMLKYLQELPGSGGPTEIRDPDFVMAPVGAIL